MDPAGRTINEQLEHIQRSIEKAFMIPDVAREVPRTATEIIMRHKEAQRKLEIRASEYVDTTFAYYIRAQHLVLCGTKFYREFLWETQEKLKWTGRNWRRIKRERNKFMRNK